MPELSLLDWLLLPLDPDRPHQVSVLVSWHGRLMVLAWGILLPLGVLIARYFKVAPRQNWPAELDNRLWWHAHLSLQWFGVVLSLTATIPDPARTWRDFLLQEPASRLCLAGLAALGGTGPCRPVPGLQRGADLSGPGRKLARRPLRHDPAEADLRMQPQASWLPGPALRCDCHSVGASHCQCAGLDVGGDLVVVGASPCRCSLPANNTRRARYLSGHLGTRPGIAR